MTRSALRQPLREWMELQTPERNAVIGAINKGGARLGWFLMARCEFSERNFPVLSNCATILPVAV
jgi:hypothetical protein